MFAAALLVGVAVRATNGQQSRGETPAQKPKVDIVQSVGCAERKSGQWWLTRATQAKASEGSFFNAIEVEEVRRLALGTNTYQLIGVADFLDTDGLLREGQRSQFTTRETANASGQLREGRKVVVKGLLIVASERPRINLTQVVSVSGTCE
jgi:hypothetical protein